MTQKLKYHWDAASSKDTEEKCRDILRLSGFTPRQDTFILPKSYEDILDIAMKIPPVYKKEDLKEALKSFIPNFTSQKNFEKYLKMGDKFSDEEVKMFSRFGMYDKEGNISVEEFIEFLYKED